MLSAVQVTVGEISQIQDVQAEREEAVYADIIPMQTVHAHSYSFIFSTLYSSGEIDAAYERAIDNDPLQKRVRIMLCYYYGDDPLKHRVPATLLSSLLLYTGFCLPPHFSIWAKLMDTAGMIRLIPRDKVVYSYYSDYKYQHGLEIRSEEKHKQMRDSTHTLLEELYKLEIQYPGALYGPPRLMNDVVVFVRYNANKALMNLGYPTRFAPEKTEVKAEILVVLASGVGENHDFFFGSGSSYVIGTAEETSDEDWEL